MHHNVDLRERHQSDTRNVRPVQSPKTNGEFGVEFDGRKGVQNARLCAPRQKCLVSCHVGDDTEKGFLAERHHTRLKVLDHRLGRRCRKRSKTHPCHANNETKNFPRIPFRENKKFKGFQARQKITTTLNLMESMSVHLRTLYYERKVAPNSSRLIYFFRYLFLLFATAFELPSSPSTCRT